MYMTYLLGFCRVAIGLVFLLAFWGKVRGFTTFAHTIIAFRLLPHLLAPLAGIVFLTSELVIIVSLLEGRYLLKIGFLFAIIDLTVFTIALTSVIARGIQTRCNCFGSTEKLISSYDLVRNAGFLLCAAVGLMVSEAGEVLTVGEWILVGTSAGGFVLTWLNVREILEFALFS